MPKGQIPEALRLSTLTRLVNQDMQAPKTFFMGLVGTPVNYPSDSIEWESQVGNMGMTPFVAPGSVAPALAPSGVGQHSAKCAFWKEKMYMDEEWLNNMRRPGTIATYETAEMKMVRELAKMKNRCIRRREWMCARMFTDGVLTYLTQGETKFTMSYGLPSEHMVTLSGDARWEQGASPDMKGDFYDAKEALSDAVGAAPTHVVFNSHTLRLMVEDSTVVSLLEKQAYGSGDLFSNPTAALSRLFGVGNMVLYDEKFKVYAWITGLSSTLVTVDDISDFEAGATVRFINTKTGAYEDEVIASVDQQNSQFTLVSAPTATFVAGRDRVVASKKYIPDNKIIFIANTVEGQKVAEFMQAPFGLDRHYGQKVDRHEEWDPEGIWLRIQDKGLPVLYRRDSIYILTHSS